MIRSSSEAMCETVGSIMGQHCAKGLYLDPENFSKELALNFNLGPLKDLVGLIDEVLALDSAKSYLRKQVTIRRTITGDLNKSAALATFQKKSLKSHISQHPFGNLAPNRD